MDYFPWPSTDLETLPEGWSLFTIDGEEIEAPDYDTALDTLWAIRALAK